MTPSSLNKMTLGGVTMFEPTISSVVTIPLAITFRAMEQVNACGSCSFCCKAPSIMEEDMEGKGPIKPHGETCTHCEVKGGCAIYNERPTTCKDYMCQWAQGLGGQLRPDVAEVAWCMQHDPTYGDNRAMLVGHCLNPVRVLEKEPNRLLMKHYLTLSDVVSAVVLRGPEKIIRWEALPHPRRPMCAEIDIDQNDPLKQEVLIETEREAHYKL